MNKKKTRKSSWEWYAVKLLYECIITGNPIPEKIDENYSDTHKTYEESIILACLTCNGGSPCKDLAIGFSELDAQKYELHIKTTSKAIEVAKQHGRDDMAEKHQKNLVRYQGILKNIQEGNIIFGRQERIRRKVVVGNGQI